MDGSAMNVDKISADHLEDGQHQLGENVKMNYPIFSPKMSVIP